MHTNYFRCALRFIYAKVHLLFYFKPPIGDGFSQRKLLKLHFQNKLVLNLFLLKNFFFLFKE